VVKESDIFISLFFTKVGKFTEEEFEAAYGQFLKSGKPHVYTYFKNAFVNIGSMNRADSDSLFNFKEKLKSLKHYPTEYTDINDLKNQFRIQLDKLLSGSITI
jgi:hypothetical protein